MNEDNKIVSIDFGGRGEKGWAERDEQKSQTAKYIEWLESVIEELKRKEYATDSDDCDGCPDQLAIAVFARHSDGIDVLCGGFADDKAASKYLQAFIRNQGFAP
jgi:hypothetical protein